MKAHKATEIYFDKNLFYHEKHGVGIGLDLDVDNMTLKVIFLDDGDLAPFRTEEISLSELRKAKKSDLLEAKTKLMLDPHQEYHLLFALAFAKESK